MKLEINELELQNTWNLVKLPPNRTHLKERWVYKIKTDLNNNIIKYKSRWVVKGFDQILGLNYLKTFSTTCKPESYKLIFILAMSNKWKLLQYDVKNAFVHANIDANIYVKQPISLKRYYNKNSNKYKLIKNVPNFESNNRNKPELLKLYCKLNKALYELKQSPRLWYKHLLEALTKLSFEVLPYDEAIFIHNKLKIIIICHVNDFIFTRSNNNEISNIIKKLTRTIKIKYISEVHQFLRIKIKLDYKEKSIHINQNKYLNSLLKRFNKKDLNPITTPVEARVRLDKATNTTNKNNLQLYQQQVSSLIYLATKTKPDIAYAINKCAKYMSNPNLTHFKALNRIWKYLNKYPNIGTYYLCNKTFLELLRYTNANWERDINSRKSTNSFLFLINNYIISWLSILQKTVALSSCEAKYIAFKEAIKEILYLHNLVSYFNNFLNNNKTLIPKLLTDRESALKLANNPEFQKRSKHIDITYHFIRNEIANNKLSLLYVNTTVQLADGFTKALDNNK